MRLVCLLFVLALLPACSAQNPASRPVPDPVEHESGQPTPSVPPALPATPTPNAGPATLLSPTPTQLPKPHVVKVKAWKMVVISSTMLCEGCGIQATTVNAPPGLDIAGVQVYASGQTDAASNLAADLVYAEEIVCAPSDGEGYCGFLFGQVYNQKVTFTARHIRGGWQQLRYIITFQSWEDYQPPEPAVTKFPYPPPTESPYPPP